MEEVTEIGRGEHVSSQGRKDTLISDGDSTLIEGAAGGIAHGHAAGNQSIAVTVEDSSAALEDGEKRAEGLGSELLGHLPSAENEARSDGQGAERGNGSDVDQVGGLETDGGVVHRVGHDQVGIDHLSDNGNVSNSSHHREKTVRSGHDDVRKNGDLEADSTEDQKEFRLHHRPGASPSTSSSSSAVNSNVVDFSTKGGPHEEAGGSPCEWEVFSTKTRSRHEEVDGGGSTRERSGETNDGMANGERVGEVRGGVHGANIASGRNAKRGSGEQEYPGYASTKNTSEKAAGDVGNNGFANDDNNVVQVRRTKQGDGVHVGVFDVEDMADANGHQKPARPSLEERDGEADIQNQLRGGNAGGMGYEGAIIKCNNESSRGSNVNDDSDSNNKEGGEIHRLLVGHDTTDEVSAQGREGLNGGGGDPNLLQGEILGAATSEHARVPGDVDFGKRMGAEHHREKHHESTGSGLGPKGGNRREVAAALVTSPQGYNAACGASGYEGKEGGRDLQTPHGVRDRRMSSVNGGVLGDDGAPFVKPEDNSLQDDGSSTVSSISSGQWKPSPTKNKKARKAGVETEQEQEDGVEARAASGGGPERRERTLAGAGTGGGSYDVSSSADNSSYASRRQVSLCRMS